MSSVSLDSFFHDTLPVKIPELRRKHIVRLRGVVREVAQKEADESLGIDWGRVEKLMHPTDAPKYTLRGLEGVAKALCFMSPMIVPTIGVAIEVIATEGGGFHFVKWWREIEPADRFLKSDEQLEEMVLETLAGSPDERITSDDLHTPDILAYIAEKGRDRRILGAVLGSLSKRGILKSVGAVRSVRKECHFRPNSQMWTWAYKEES